MARTRTNRRASAAVTAALMALATALALAPVAQAAVSVSRAELSSGQLRVEGTGAQPGSTVTVRSSASSAGATADSKGAFRVEASGFSAPDCRVTVSDPVSSASATLSGCTVSTQPPPPPAPSTTVAVSSLVVRPAKVVQGETGTGTVTLNRAPDGSVTVLLAADGQVSIPPSVTISAPATSATFPITTFALNRTFLIHVSAGVSTTEAQTTFFQVPTAQTDIITIPTATLSKNGDLQVSATSDNAGVTLTAFFGDTRVGVLRNDGGGKFSGTFKINAQDGVVVLRSNLGGCSQRSVNRPTGWQYC